MAFIKETEARKELARFTKDYQFQVKGLPTQFRTIAVRWLDSALAEMDQYIQAKKAK